eukprot:3125016-Rhodomonas_salina.2
MSHTPDVNDWAKCLSPVFELPTTVRWINFVPEDAEQFFVGNLRGVVAYLHGTRAVARTPDAGRENSFVALGLKDGLKESRVSA